MSGDTQDSLTSPTWGHSDPTIQPPVTDSPGKPLVMSTEDSP